MKPRYNKRSIRVKDLDQIKQLKPRIFARFLGLYSAYLVDLVNFSDFSFTQALSTLRNPKRAKFRAIFSDMALILDVYRNGDRFLVRALATHEYQLDLFESEIIGLTYLDLIFNLFIDQKRSFKRAVLDLNLNGSSYLSRYFAVKPKPTKRLSETEIKMGFITELVHLGLTSIEVIDHSSKVEIEMSYRVDRELIFEVVIIDKINSVISIQSRIASRRQSYLEISSRLFFEDNGYYTSDFQISAEPLIKSIRSAISTSGFIGFRDVQLRKIVFKSINEPYEQVVLKDSNNLIDHLGSHIISYIMNWHNIVEFELAFHFRDRKRPIIVSCKSPNHLIYDRRRYDEQVLAFLINRGFIVAPNEASGAMSCSV